MPEQMEQLEEVPKMTSQNVIQRRTAEQIVDLPALVFLERTSKRICEQTGVVDGPKFAVHRGADAR